MSPYRNQTDLSADLVGVVDVGSNSIRLVVFEDGVRSPDYVFNEKTICRLGEGLNETGRLNPEGRALALAAIRRFVALARAMEVGELIGVGTAAMREAEDAPEFRDQVARETGLEIRVATGREEARLSAEGVLFGWPDVKGVIADLGGASLELAAVRQGHIGPLVSTPAGHLTLSDPAAAPRALQAIAAAAAPFAAQDGALVLVGGAWRALAKAQMSRTNYPLHVLMGYEMTPEEVLDLCAWAQGAAPEALKKATGSGQGRLGSVAGGAAALARLVETLAPDRVVISAYGLREGLIHQRMPADLRSQEPLITAAARMERRYARAPGFGDELFRWIAPVLDGFSDDWMRLSQAACLLHDVNWRAHPDFRAAACFATVARSNLTGVGHKSRLFIGAALLNRYKSPDLSRAIKDALTLIPEEERKAAQALGRAIRLGAMLTGSNTGLLAQSRLEVAEGALVLSMEQDMADLAGERVLRRLQALADTLGLESRLAL